MSRCKICGKDAVTPEWVKEFSKELAEPEDPEVDKLILSNEVELMLTSFCEHCANSAVGHWGEDQYGEGVHHCDGDFVVQWVSWMLLRISKHIANGHPPIFCEARRNNSWNNRPCDKLAKHHINGMYVCGWHKNHIDKGHEVIKFGDNSLPLIETFARMLLAAKPIKSGRAA